MNDTLATMKRLDGPLCLQCGRLLTFASGADIVVHSIDGTSQCPEPTKQAEPFRSRSQHINELEYAITERDKTIRALRARLDGRDWADKLTDAQLSGYLSKNQRLQEALEKYGRHKSHCAEQKPARFDFPNCTCGLEAAFAGKDTHE